MTNPITLEQRAACVEALGKATPGPWRYDGCDVWGPASEDVVAVGPYGDEQNVAGVDTANAALITHAPTWLAAYEARVIRLEAELEKSDRQVSELSSRMVTNVRRESRREVLRSLLRAERAASVDHNAPSRESVLIDRALAAEARVAELEDQIRTSQVEACVLRSGLAEEIKRSAEYNKLLSIEREHERAATVKWLRAQSHSDDYSMEQLRWAADRLEAGAHLPGGRDEG